MSSPSPQRSIARRVTLWVIGMVGLALAVVAVTISILTEREIRPQVLHTVGGTVDSLVLALDSLEEANRVAVLRTFRVFRSSFQSPPTRVEESNGAGAHNDFGTVERFSQETGGIATVFLRKGDDFVVIETSLKEEKSESAQNSLLGRSSPAYQRMLNGQEHTGRVELFGKHYMGHYGALKDDAGKVLYVGKARSIRPRVRSYFQDSTLSTQGWMDRAPQAFVEHRANHQHGGRKEQEAEDALEHIHPVARLGQEAIAQGHQQY